ncbi:aminobenzoyl-glutamate utilization protein B [Haladaptatus litoreus]|uniref:Aminobenzoyl-glutamate utilization protein B n=1 Tax=Haladaptatus litoreus TaxID=553468 RepID=A0A1N7CMN5_9EURY|nr:amidohydrolase [Haladaptatus litoreus]SIR64805.1 aminobenzoyl-glutamate utilization protein B [Haladaptatus litoreus]
MSRQEYESLKQGLFETIEAERDRLKTVARDIWENPEVALQESASSERLQSILREEGFEVTTGVGGIETAFIARYGQENPVVGTMGEFDALPGMSQQAKAEREPVEAGAPGHGCGHNLFGVGSLGAAIAVKDAIERNELSGSVVFFGTPAEEAGGGKVYMVRDGAFDDVDAVVSWHPGWYNAPGKGSCLAVDAFDFTFHGETSHAAASPESGRSALDAVQLLNTGVEYMREHVSDAARIHYVIQNGGSAANVVPGEASVEYLVRAPEREEVERISEWVRDIADAAAQMTRTDLNATKTSGMYGVLPNHTIADAIRENMEHADFPLDDEQAEFAAELRETLGDGEGAIQQIPEPNRDIAREEAIFSQPIDALDEGQTGSYSTDSGDVSWNVPLGRFRAATWPVGTPAHSWQAVAAGESLGTAGMEFASKTIAATLADLLEDAELRQQARMEFEERLAGHEYESPLPEGADPYELVKR